MKTTTTMMMRPMKRYTVTRWIVTGGAVIAFAAPVLAGDQPDPAKTGSEVTQKLSHQPSVEAPPPQMVMPIYRPPKVGKPARTVGGGSRGPGDGFPALYALVPNHVGRTASSQPSLFWYVDNAPAGAQVEFTLLDEDGIEPLIETKLEPPSAAGVNRIKLEDYGVKLQPGIEYEWSVAIIADPKDRSKDIVATGWIDVVERPADLDTRIASEGAVHALADEGLWYDALTALGDRMETSPGDPELPQMRDALLKQVGLQEIAASI